MPMSLVTTQLRGLRQGGRKRENYRNSKKQGYRRGKKGDSQPEIREGIK